MTSLSPLPVSSEAPISSPVAVRPRAFWVGLPLLCSLCAFSVYADMASQVVQVGVLQIPPPAVAALFFLVLFNRALASWFQKAWLNRGELLVIYSMLLVGVLVSTRGVVEKLIPPLAYLPYFATRENGLAETVGAHLPAWAVPFTPGFAPGNASPEIRAFWEGSGGTLGAVPWSFWIGPLCAWLALVGCVLWCFFCLAALLRRQWVDNEQLRFPLTALPLAMINDQSEGQPFWSSKTMWWGFGTAFGFFIVNGLAANFPDVPAFATEFPLAAFLSEKPWNAMDWTPLYISLAAIAFFYFLPAELLFSLWFFFWMARFQDILAVQFGGLPVGIGTHNARVFTGFQAAGAYFVLIAIYLRIGWPHFRAVWRTALGKTGGYADDSQELLSSRAALVGLALGFVGVVLWLALAGMSPLVAGAQMGLFLFFIAVIMSRAVNEGGLLMTETSFLPSHVLSLLTPIPALGPQNVAMLGLTNIVFTRDLRGVLLSVFLDSQKMAKEIGLSPRQLRAPLLTACAVSCIVGSAFFLALHYGSGGLNLYSYPKNNAANLFWQASAQNSGSGFTPDATAYGGFVLGGVFTLFLTFMRARFAWFPLHPLGYALAPTWAMMALWFAAFVAWIIKTCVLRFGGIDAYRKLAPFMLGLILGEFSCAMFWSLGNITRGWSAPFFPWP